MVSGVNVFRFRPVGAWVDVAQPENLDVAVRGGADDHHVRISTGEFPNDLAALGTRNTGVGAGDRDRPELTGSGASHGHNGCSFSMYSLLKRNDFDIAAGMDIARGVENSRPDLVAGIGCIGMGSRQVRMFDQGVYLGLRYVGHGECLMSLSDHFP